MSDVLELVTRDGQVVYRTYIPPPPLDSLETARQYFAIKSAVKAIPDWWPCLRCGGYGTRRQPMLRALWPCTACGSTGRSTRETIETAMQEENARRVEQRRVYEEETAQMRAIFSRLTEAEYHFLQSALDRWRHVRCLEGEIHTERMEFKHEDG